MANHPDRASQIFRQGLLGTGNQATSVVDFLKSRGLQPAQGEKFPLFGQRGQLFNQFGLNQSLGEFRGSAEQNTALLNQLGRAETSAGVNITAQNIGNIISASQAPATQTLSTIGGAGDRTAAGTLSQDFLTRTQAQPEVTPGTPGSTEDGKDISLDEAEGRFAQGETLPFAVVRRLAARKGMTVEEYTASVRGTSPAGAGGAGLLPEIPSGQDLASQALATVTGSATFPLELEAEEAKKNQIRLEAQREKESFIQNIASRGLFFSGAKTKGLNVIEADKLANVLGVDRKFALLIAQGLEESARQIAKEAQAGRKEAIDSLKALGFAINPITGKIEPTLSARRQAGEAERAETRIGLDVAAEQRLRAGQAIGQEEFAIQEARKQEAAAFSQALRVEQLQISQNRLALDITKEARIAATAGEISPKDIQKRNEELAADVDAIIALGSREAAMEAVNSRRFTVATKYGPEGMDQIQAAIDEAFPLTPPAGFTAPTLPGAAAAGARARGAIPEGLLGPTVGDIFIGTVGEAALKVESFLQGFFGAK